MGLRAAANKEGPGSASQDRMDQIITVAKKGKESASLGNMNELAI